MQDLHYALFEAHHPQRNHHRSYSVEVGRGLFGEYVLAARFGRVGTSGMERQAAADTAEGLQALARARLRRRLTAPRRIGCSYRLVHLTCDTALSAGDWIPVEFLAEVDGVPTTRWG